MAVIQISRIQLRRGRANSGTGIPQLASGEMGWAVDTQELFIGNGSVSEGAPYVGNTKLLSEHDNLFEFARNYSYKRGQIQSGPTENNPVIRSLQARLDDRVSVRSFGMNGDGSDITADLQRAIDQLFLLNKSSETSRVELILEPGTYNISNTIYLPPYATLRGAGKEKTYIRQTGSFPAFTTVNSSSTPGTPANSSTDSFDNQAQRISLKGMTISTAGIGSILKLQSCRNSTFEDLRIKGTWPDSSYAPNWFVDVGIELSSLSTVVTCQDNVFKDVEIVDCGYAVQSNFDIINNTWDDCEIVRCGYGFDFGSQTLLGVSGQSFGPRNNLITNTTFEDIDRHAIWITNGSGNLSQNNKFYGVGNDGDEDEENATYSVINFVSSGNQTSGDWFNRTNNLSLNQAYINGTPYIPEVQGGAVFESIFPNQVNLSTVGSYQKLFRLPAEGVKAYEIDYVYKSSAVNANRQGKLTITIDPVNQLANLTDDFNFIGDSAFAENLSLQAALVDENIDGTVDTLAVNVLNSTTSDDATIYFKVKTLV